MSVSELDCMELARRVCGSSRQICDLLSSRIVIDPSIITSCASLQDPINAEPADPDLFPSSMDVDEQLAHFRRLDAISAKINDWARLSGVPAKPRLKRKISKAQNESRENLSIDHDPGTPDETISSVATPEVTEAVVTPDDIRAFNERSFGSTVDVSKMCDADKQTLRPIFKHVPKLKEFILQLETAVDMKPKTTAAVAQDEDPQTTRLLERLYELIVDVTYLEEHENIYGRQDIQPYDDVVQSCLEQLYKQIMNQEN